MHTSLGFLLEHRPPGLQLVLACRADPPLALARLRARGQLGELRAATCGSPPRKPPPSCARRSGPTWPRRPRWRWRSAPKEVLERQTGQVRAFLLETSVLERLSGELCDAVTGRTDGQAILAPALAAALLSGYAVVAAAAGGALMRRCDVI